jgi:hypothetical protein
MGFYAAVDGLPDEEAGTLARLQAESNEAEAKLKAELLPEAKKSGVPIELLTELVKYKAKFPDEFARLHREVSRAAAEQEAQHDNDERSTFTRRDRKRVGPHSRHV